MFAGDAAILSFNIGSEYQRKVILDTCRGTRCYGYPDITYLKDDKGRSTGERQLNEDDPEVWIARPILDQTVVTIAWAPFSHQGDTTIWAYEVKCTTLE